MSVTSDALSLIVLHRRTIATRRQPGICAATSRSANAIPTVIVPHHARSSRSAESNRPKPWKRDDRRLGTVLGPRPTSAAPFGPYGALGGNHLALHPFDFIVEFSLK